MTIDQRTAGSLAETGLSAVLGPEIVSGLRPDSPLSGVGLGAADLVGLSDAIADAASRRGVQCILDDGDLDGLETVSDLVASIAAAGSASL